MIQSGTYDGTAEDLTFEFRVECEAEGRPAARVVSGDVHRGDLFIASFQCGSPVTSDDKATISGSLVFRGQPELFTGAFTLAVDDRERPRGWGCIWWLLQR